MEFAGVGSLLIFMRRLLNCRVCCVVWMDGDEGRGMLIQFVCIAKSALAEVTCGHLLVSVMICGNGTGLQVQPQSSGVVRFVLYHFILNIFNIEYNAVKVCVHVVAFCIALQCTKTEWCLCK